MNERKERDRQTERQALGKMFTGLKGPGCFLTYWEREGGSEGKCHKLTEFNLKREKTPTGNSQRREVQNNSFCPLSCHA